MKKVVMALISVMLLIGCASSGEEKAYYDKMKPIVTQMKDIEKEGEKFYGELEFTAESYKNQVSALSNKLTDIEVPKSFSKEEAKQHEAYTKYMQASLQSWISLAGFLESKYLNTDLRDDIEDKYFEAMDWLKQAQPLVDKIIKDETR